MIVEVSRDKIDELIDCILDKFRKNEKIKIGNVELEFVFGLCRNSEKCVVMRKGVLCVIPDMKKNDFEEEVDLVYLLVEGLDEKKVLIVLVSYVSFGEVWCEPAIDRERLRKFIEELTRCCR